MNQDAQCPSPTRHYGPHQLKAHNYLLQHICHTCDLSLQMPQSVEIRNYVLSSGWDMGYQTFD